MNAQLPICAQIRHPFHLPLLVCRLGCYELEVRNELGNDWFDRRVDGGDRRECEEVISEEGLRYATCSRRLLGLQGARSARLPSATLDNAMAKGNVNVTTATGAVLS